MTPVCFLHESSTDATHICPDCMRKRGFEITRIEMAKINNINYRVRLINIATGIQHGREYVLWAGDTFNLTETVDGRVNAGVVIDSNDWIGARPYGQEIAQPPDSTRDGLPKRIRDW